MKSYFNAGLIPCVLYLIAIVDAHGGNDKAPFLVIIVALLSFIMGLLYFIMVLSKKQKRENLQKAAISILPFIVTLSLFALARAGLVDTLPILGFR